MASCLVCCNLSRLKGAECRDKAGWPRPSGRLSGTIGRPLRKGRFVSVSRLQHSGLMTRLRGYWWPMSKALAEVGQGWGSRTRCRMQSRCELIPRRLSGIIRRRSSSKFTVMVNANSAHLAAPFCPPPTTNYPPSHILYPYVASFPVDLCASPEPLRQLAASQDVAFEAGCGCGHEIAAINELTQRIR